MKTDPFVDSVPYNLVRFMVRKIPQVAIGETAVFEGFIFKPWILQLVLR